MFSRIFSLHECPMPVLLLDGNLMFAAGVVMATAGHVIISAFTISQAILGWQRSVGTIQCYIFTDKWNIFPASFFIRCEGFSR